MAQAAPRIAVIDDDPSVLNALRRTLRVRGFQADTYASAQEFLETLPGGLPACLILDLHMPEMGGLELLQYLTYRGLKIPTIMITSDVDMGARERSQSAGAIAVLLKPLEGASLFAAIDDAIKNKRDPSPKPAKH
jgi:FixJ family two-component response regulator